MITSMKRLSTLAVATVTLLSTVASGDIPSHPEQLSFPDLNFMPPMAEEHRWTLPNGVPAYLMPSTEFPLITISFTFRGGAYLEDADETGLAAALGSMMRRGGTTTVSAEELDERFDYLAANVTAFVGSEQSGASINCLKSNFDEAFGLFLDMVQRPGFDQERLRVHIDQQMEEMKQRNDFPMSVAMMNMSRMVYGEDHYAGRQPTKSTIESITPAKLRALHARIFHPGNLIISATGDFKPEEMIDRLGRVLGNWEFGATAGDPPAPQQAHKPGVYHADVNQEDLPQGTMIMLTKSMKRDDPDVIPFRVMNHVLGGGGFTSRIMNRVRSDEGLAYSASSFFQPQVYYPGLFGAFFQSKNPTVALASKIVIEEIDRICDEPVSYEELEVAKNSFIEQFPQRFASKSATLGVFVNDEMTNREPGYWKKYRDRVRAVTQDDVQRVARNYLNADKLMMLVVGDWDEIYPGDLEGRASMNDFFGGNVTHMPMLDPLTLKPMN